MKYQNVIFTSASVKRYNVVATKTTDEGRINTWGKSYKGRLKAHYYYLGFIHI